MQKLVRKNYFVITNKYLFKINCTNMENCNYLTNFKKYCLDQLNYIYAAWNALVSYSNKLEEENKALKEENNTLKEERDLADKKLEEMIQVFNTFINQDVKQRNIFEEIESPENVRRFFRLRGRGRGLT
ncbi:unnamed protein product [Meloidogyne enterolobii]|uniref:Uncharacterized protein n=1 Tax=Meloidogyne enterolobii TaxID=390850 RepID=A0ACB1AN98_MELEN